MVPLAALSMYEWPETRPALDVLWSFVAGDLRSRGIDAPRTLTTREDLASAAADGSLLIGQICGLTLSAAPPGLYRYVTTPAYALDHADQGDYYSVLVCRADEAETALTSAPGAVAAINNMESFSGHRALFRTVFGSAAGCFEKTVLTGSHLESMHAVAVGRADIAAIDAVSFRLAERYRPDLTAALCVFALSAPIAGLALVSSAATDDTVIERLRQALSRAAAAAECAPACAALFLKGFRTLPPDAYTDHRRP